MIFEANLHWRYCESPSYLVMPWYTLPCLQWLKEQDTKNWNVFEFGAGYSIIWWRLNAKSIDSVESDKDWAKAMGVWHTEDKMEYVDAAVAACDTEELFDCIIVDGKWREECVIASMDCLKSGGHLIIDNYQSEDYNSEVTDHLLSAWNRQIFQQPNHSIWKTAVFTKP